MTEENIQRRRGVYLLPNLITTLSFFAGFLAIIWSSQNRFEDACMAIIFAALMDGLDGKIARLTNTASEFGVQYDSLSDLVAFGVAPANLLWHWHLHGFGRLGVAVCFLFAVCGALRLARFNVSTAVINKKFFIGLPTPAAGCTAVSFVYFANFIPTSIDVIVPPVALVLTLALAMLMVSRVRYYSFKEYAFVKAHPFSSMVTVILLVALIASQPKILFFLVMLGYIVVGLTYTYFILPRRNRELLRGLSLNSD